MMAATLACQLMPSDPGAAEPSHTSTTVQGVAARPTDLPLGPNVSAAAPHSDSVPVVACELFPPMAQLAAEVVARNGLGDRIRIIPKRSDELLVSSSAASRGRPSDATPSAASRRRAVMADLAAASERACSLPGRVDVIISEIFDSQLLGEGLLPTLRDAVPRLLKVGDIPR